MKRIATITVLAVAALILAGLLCNLSGWLIFLACWGAASVGGAIIFSAAIHQKEVRR